MHNIFKIILVQLLFKISLIVIHLIVRVSRSFNVTNILFNLKPRTQKSPVVKYLHVTRDTLNKELK